MELENGGTTNTILSFFMVQSIGIYQETPPTHLILIDFSPPHAFFPGTALSAEGMERAQNFVFDNDGYVRGHLNW